MVYERNRNEILSAKNSCRSFCASRLCRGMRVQDGFCFTQTAIEGEESEDGIHEHDRVDAMLILYTTFMNEADMSDTQRGAINKEHLETWMRCMEELQREINA